MSTRDDTERRLRSWLADEAQADEPVQLFDAIASGSRGMPQRPALVVRLRAGGMGPATGSALGASGARRFGSLVLIALLIALLTVVGVLVGSQLVAPSRTPLVPADRGVFTPTGTMLEPRDVPTATLLRDGRVLIVGGYQDPPSPAGPAEVWDPRTGLFSPAGSLPHGRSGQAAIRLGDDRVLVVGGASNDQDSTIDGLTSAEVWDPVTMTFGATGSLVSGRLGATATLLPDGRVLVQGGTDLEGVPVTTLEVWDPATDSFGPPRRTPDAPAVRRHPAR